MKSYLIPAVRLTIILILLLSGIYTLIVFGIAQIAPNHGKGEIVKDKGKVYYSNIGQSFTEDKYFWSRPSAVDYNAAGSGGSNMSPYNKDYLKTVQSRIDTFLVHNPGIKKQDIPIDLVTASGSGLDPDISPADALIQVPRIAYIRHLPEEKVKVLVNANIQQPLWGLLGTAKVNVLKLNIALDKLSSK